MVLYIGVYYEKGKCDASGEQQQSDDLAHPDQVSLVSARRTAQNSDWPRVPWSSNAKHCPASSFHTSTQNDPSYMRASCGNEAIAAFNPQKLR